MLASTDILWPSESSSLPTSVNDIRLSNDDARRFLAKNLPKDKSREQVFVYLDPPYVSNGNRLYLNNYQAKDHSRLANQPTPATSRKLGGFIR